MSSIDITWSLHISEQYDLESICNILAKQIREVSMKRIALLLVLMMSVVMVACGNAETGKDGPALSDNGSVTKTEEITLSEYINEYNEILRSGVEKKTNFTGEDSDYIACAQTLLNGMLKNPYSAQYNASAVYEKDSYGRAIVYMDVSSQNSFGGWVREEYFFLYSKS